MIKMCEWERKVNAYWDNELPTEEAQDVARHLQTCVECQLTLNSLRRIRQILLQESLPATPTAIFATFDRLNREGAFQVPRWRSWLLQLDSWLMGPKVAFKVAMAASLASALILANLSAQISQAAVKVQGSFRHAVQSISWEQILQRLETFFETSQPKRR
ncbi:MAG: zf-HC2 domain-containing protein [Armatimonadetes bacterium]|nr:zf-HC2 domain-containing protein [Armatimonadota bacterium]MDW8027125.1 zf-HC2 domain-containing protein [Armatimonadota bacterium]